MFLFFFYEYSVLVSWLQNLPSSLDCISFSLFLFLSFMSNEHLWLVFKRESLKINDWVRLTDWQPDQMWSLSLGDSQ